MMNVVSKIDTTSTPYIYRGEDCTDEFVEQLSRIKDEVEERIRENKPMEELTEEQKIEFKNATRCSICNKCFKAVMKELETIAIFLENTVDAHM